ncbi:hypothetical protein ACFE04_014052 [Oxalis oulophora]
MSDNSIFDQHSQKNALLLLQSCYSFSHNIVLGLPRLVILHIEIATYCYVSATGIVVAKKNGTVDNFVTSWQRWRCLGENIQALQATFGDLNVAGEMPLANNGH